MKQITVLGAGTGFAAELLDALALGEVPPTALVLQGRRPSVLASLLARAMIRLGPLGWRVSTTTSIEAALDGSSIVVHQIRYGGLAGRTADERLAVATGLPADETLGPSGLVAAVRAAPGVRATGALLAARCPDAVVLNLTNPLSITTSLLARSMARGTVVGLCELPLVTVDEAVRRVGSRSLPVTWSYRGLNHRGFIHRLRQGDDDLLERLGRTPGIAVGGVGSEIVRGLGVLPLKYFTLLDAPPGVGSGRADVLARVRAEIEAELAERPDRRPPSLDGRDQPWYRLAVVPALTGLLGGPPGAVIASWPDSDGLAREHRAVAGGGRIDPIDRQRSALPPPAAAWEQHFEAHERAVLDAVDRPDPGRLATAVNLDPLVPPHARSRVLGEVLAAARSALAARS